ncbi:MAG TPA: NfeD family protein [Acidimicrobiia bacterium]|nr:NfeD family protein [Acidimicrobiia bacterium]
MIRRLLVLLAMLLALPVWPATAGDGAARVDVVVVDGIMDRRMVDFVRDAIESSDAALVVLQVDVPAVLTGEASDLVSLVADPPVPLAVWVGPDPAVAHGTAAVMLSASRIRGAAPGAEVGWASPLVAGRGSDPDAVAALAPELPEALYETRITVGAEPVAGVVDFPQPSLGQFIVGLDGMTVEVEGERVTLSTARRSVDQGQDVVSPIPVRFIEPGLVDRALRLAISPEAAFFFLVLGLSLAAFEFYAAGPGLAAGVAAICLLLAGYGIAVLPVWWPAVAAVLVGVWLYVVEFQRNDLGWKSLLGTALLVGGGLRFVDASPQLVPNWWMVSLVVLGGALFFGFALTTVVRARFSTHTIGREHLVGRVGTASGAIAPEGIVIVDGAEWRARSSRASGIDEGDRVRVTEVVGVVLEVEKE